MLSSDFNIISQSVWAILQLKYLFIDAYKDAPIAGLQYLLEFYLLELFVKTQFSIWKKL